jgi:PIN domain-containing protein
MVDNDLPPRLARALNIIFEADGDEVIALRDKFGRSNVKDADWIGQLGTEGHWAVLSADRRIAKQRPSRELFIGAGLVGFFFPPSLQKEALYRQAARVIALWPDLRDQVRLNANGCFEMPASGRRFRQIGR